MGKIFPFAPLPSETSLVEKFLFFEMHTAQVWIKI
jgi:hypothetical protein